MYYAAGHAICFLIGLFIGAVSINLLVKKTVSTKFDIDGTFHIRLIRNSNFKKINTIIIEQDKKRKYFIESKKEEEVQE